ncbi:carbohydrate kinase family protein [Lipingzhangella sp. LS1_29]|uniref:Carbohydrate kinase family protein n=1 Tax=Lipingzhangella rawalii TaxID=2055835 RepID=A0ABU2H115_9ACTN|nr:carbohydrate kinase family protein [Lipingzhangella rawalii]MDS1268682.1 carbohydrate kinase family protein [Lipingzhangella rawalii]
MRIAVAASIATDNLMTFQGRISEQLIADQLEQISLSFLVDQLDVRYGGVAANISFSMGQLGQRPILVGSVGPDFEEYRQWLDRHGVDTSQVRVSSEHHTARFVCTTDQDKNQIASFYPGAMAEARDISIGEVADRVGGLDLVLIGADDPVAMTRHTEQCRELGIPFAADPSQQMALMDGEGIRSVVDGAAYLLTNEYEKSLCEQKTGWSDEEVLDRVGMRITTLGEKGSRIDRKGEPPIHVPSAQVNTVADPTGAGDAFRAGFFTGLGRKLSLERSLQLGNAVAVHVLETSAPQEHTLTTQSITERLSASYGDEVAQEIGATLS